MLAALPAPGSMARIAIIQERLNRLRLVMKADNLDVCIIPSSDPHQSEYLAECWKFREYLSGFTGSCGTLVVGKNKAAYWTDSRYFLQAEAELEGTDIELFKLALPGTPSVETWIARQGYVKAGIDGTMFSTNEVLRLNQFFAGKAICLSVNFRPYEIVWPDRPLLPQGKLMLFPETYSGESVSSKLSRIRDIMRETDADGMPVATLDDIAWLLNIRGMDVDFNPVVMAFAYVSLDCCMLFVESAKLTAETKAHFAAHKVEIAGYTEFSTFISRLKGARILFDKARNNYEIYEQIDESCTIIESRLPVCNLKAIKNPIELAGFREAMLKDGVALVRLLKWIETETDPGKITGNPFPTEWTISEKAAGLRREQGLYLCESFAPIVAFRDHGAIVHYEAERSTCYTVSGEGVLLMDLGAHFLNGSTDTTRTIYLNGTPPEQYRDDYTCLLKGVIALTRASFPEGTRGTQLDILARQFIWEKNLNYLHGTGHGVGHCLFVHEGPQSIRMNENPVTIDPGMVMSNEPALYRTGEYGVRVENVIHVLEKEPCGYGRFFTFETLTLVPLDLKSINPSLLRPDEKVWINSYQETVFNALSPRLNENEQTWLREKTQAME